MVPDYRWEGWIQRKRLAKDNPKQGNRKSGVNAGFPIRFDVQNGYRTANTARCLNLFC